MRLDSVPLAPALALLASCAAAPAAAPPEAGPCVTWGGAEAVASVADPALLELSGIAVSRLHDDLLWVLEDSGGPAALVALGLDGRTRGTLTLTGVTNKDWEDLAAGPCGDRTCLFVGDIGDNKKSRDDAAVLRVVEPAFDSEPFELVAEPDVFPFTYAGGPRDAEALLVTPAGVPVVIDKVKGGTATLHRFGALTPGVPVVLEEVATIVTSPGSSGELPTKATAADLDPTGDRLLVRTYGSLWVYDLAGGGLAGATTATRTALPHGLELQAEAAAWAPDGRSLWHVAEGQHPVLYRVLCADPS